MSNQGYAKPIRIFHSVFALCMLTQLAVGNLMDVPEVEGEHASSSIIPAAIAHESHGASVGPVEESLGFEVHEILGLTIAGLVLLRLLLAMTSLQGAGWRDLFPWLLADGRSRLFKEFTDVFLDGRKVAVVKDHTLNKKLGFETELLLAPWYIFERRVCGVKETIKLELLQQSNYLCLEDLKVIEIHIAICLLQK